MMRNSLTAIAAVMMTACASAPGQNASYPKTSSSAAPADASLVSSARSDALERFAPAPSGSTATVDYDLIDNALDLVVFNAGPSLRERSPRPDPLVGSLLVKGHTSGLRMEGNKVFFSQFDDGVRQAFSDYRRSLEAIGASGRVQTLPLDEQLAYWLNLHNIVVIDEIAQAYPTRRPGTIKPRGQDDYLDAADIIDLGDMQLSLRDVRHIVYANWDDPKVLYGFFRGDIGGASIRASAYDGADVNAALTSQASEFVNSLRGVIEDRKGADVSAIYREARPYFFTSWPNDLKAHLLTYANDSVKPIVAEADGFRIASYEEDIADLSGGDLSSDLGFGRSIALPRSRPALEDNGVNRDGNGMPQSMARMVREYEDKIIRLRKRGYLTPKVIIRDVPKDGGDAAD